MSANAESSRIEIPSNSDSATPTQFVYNPSDCRRPAHPQRLVANSMIAICPFITMAPDWLRYSVFFALGLIAQASLLSAAQVEDGIVAIVNSDLIMLSEMKRELASEREKIQKEYRGDGLARRLKTAEYMGLTLMIERKLQLQAAKARGITVTDEEVQQAAKQMKQQGRAIDETNQADMKNIREQLTLLRIADRDVRSGVMVADSDLKRYLRRASWFGAAGRAFTGDRACYRKPGTGRHLGYDRDLGRLSYRAVGGQEAQTVSSL
ncbi:MAG: hypothetical protein CAF45_007205 [Nitrospira sp. CG24E]|nr:MAG: hypothetical protein CAF45_007205 [Nitrospira sp. CG24E]